MEKQITLEPHKKQILLEQQNFGDWDIFAFKGNMLTSKELDHLVTLLDVKHLPEIFYGSNIFYIVNKSLNFVYEFNPIQMINLCSFKDRSLKLKEEKIYYTPSEVKVQYHEEWKNMKVKRDDIQVMEPTEDWTYTSTYLGNIQPLNKSLLQPFYSDINTANSEFKVVKNEKISIPYNKLGPENPIKMYIEIPFYEDELNDNGTSEAKLRFRIMGDSFFCLLRCYLRCDNVIVRNVDTRIYHEFGTNYIIRNFNVKECSYAQLESKGFNLKSNWSLSPNQSDEIAKYLDQVCNVTDQVFIK